MRIADIRMGVEAHIGAAVLQPVHPRQCIKPAVSGMSAAEMTEYGRIILSGFAVVDAHVPVAVTALARIGYVIVIPLHRPVIDAHRFIQRAGSQALLLRRSTSSSACVNRKSSVWLALSSYVPDTPLLVSLP